MKKEFTINVTMEERWIPHFMSFLKYMEYLGKIGSTRQVALIADGDGDFRPEFNSSIEFEIQEPIIDHDGDRIYDAG